MMGAVGAAVMLVFFTATTVRGSTNDDQCNNQEMNLARKIVADWEAANEAVALPSDLQNPDPPHPAQQSGPNKNGRAYVAQNAVDCDFPTVLPITRDSTDIASEMCSMAEREDGKNYAIWTLDLGGERFIGQINVTTTKNNEKRNAGMVVCVVPGTDANDWTELSSITDATLETLILQSNYCLTKSPMLAWFPDYTETFEFASFGQYVVIFAKNKLELCEVEVKPGITIEATCDETFHQTSMLSGYFTSPGFPDNYPNNQECSWHFSVPSTMVLYFALIRFSMESTHDTLRFYEGDEDEDPTLTFQSGTTGLSCVVSEFPSVLWEFNSDFSHGLKGFNITYSAHTKGDAQIGDLCPDDACTATTDCPDSLECIINVCSTDTCTATTDCSGSLVCVNGVCSTCDSNTSCPDEYACIDGACRVPVE